MGASNVGESFCRLQVVTAFAAQLDLHRLHLHQPLDGHIVALPGKLRV